MLTLMVQVTNILAPYDVSAKTQSPETLLGAKQGAPNGDLGTLKKLECFGNCFYRGGRWSDKTITDFPTNVEIKCGGGGGCGRAVQTTYPIFNTVSTDIKFAHNSVKKWGKIFYFMPKIYKNSAKN